MSPGTSQVFWWASRSLGIVATLLLGVSVGLGLAMAGRVSSRPGSAARFRHFHEALTLVTLGLIAGHGGLLLLDRYLHPGLTGVLIPFALPYRPLFTGLGIIAGWGAAILGLSFYLRRRIGTRTWRRMHRFTIVVYLLAVTHAVGSGTDGLSKWMLLMLSIVSAPIAFLFTWRILGHRTPARPPTAAGRLGGAQTGVSPR